jgi:hypothetical protein
MPMPVPDRRIVLDYARSQLEQDNLDRQNEEEVINAWLTRTQVDLGMKVLAKELNLNIPLSIAPTFDAIIFKTCVQNGIRKYIKDTVSREGLSLDPQKRQDYFNNISNIFRVDDSSLFTYILELYWPKNQHNFHFIIPVLSGSHFTCLVISKRENNIKARFLDSLKGNCQNKFKEPLEHFINKLYKDPIIDYQDEYLGWQIERPAINCGLFCMLLSMQEVCIAENLTYELVKFLQIITEAQHKSLEEFLQKDYSLLFASMRDTLAIKLGLLNPLTDQPMSLRKRKLETIVIDSDDDDDDVIILDKKSKTVSAAIVHAKELSSKRAPEKPNGSNENLAPRPSSFCNLV